MKIPCMFVVAALSSSLAFAELSIERTTQRIERGEYLVNKVVSCGGCHSERALDRYGFPPKENKRLGGGMVFRDIGHDAVSPNITSIALADWTDQEILNAITKGIHKSGRTLHPAMPYRRYGKMDREELYSIIAYLRESTPVKSGPYPQVFPGEFKPLHDRMGTIPRPATDASNIDKGKYLVTIGGCNGCHHGPGESEADTTPWMGGNEFPIPGRGLIRSANLTSCKTTGIGRYTEDAFVARMQAMRGTEKASVQRGGTQTVMHWWDYAYISESDLRHIYQYFTSLEPITNQVATFEPLDGPPRAGSLNYSERQ